MMGRKGDGQSGYLRKYRNKESLRQPSNGFPIKVRKLLQEAVYRTGMGELRPAHGQPFHLLLRHKGFLDADEVG